MTPSHSTNERNAAFAAALDELIPAIDPNMSRIRVLAQYEEHRKWLIARAAKGDYAKGGISNVPGGVLHGTYGVTLDQYRAVHMLIYQDSTPWASDITHGGKDG